VHPDVGLAKIGVASQPASITIIATETRRPDHGIDRSLGLTSTAAPMYGSALGGAASASKVGVFIGERASTHHNDLSGDTWAGATGQLIPG
jgi:hypothetical protein